MRVCPIRSSDLVSIGRWAKKLKTEQHLMPYNSFGVPGVAFAGLRAIDGGFWLFDAMVTNPHCSSATRNSALNAIYKYMFELTDASNGIIGLTVDAGAHARAVASGFRQLPHTVLIYTKEK